MANLPGDSLPGGYYALGINAPSSEPAADGATWFGITSKNSAGQTCYTVWRVAGPGATPELKHVTPTDEHRGVMRAELDGQLVVTVYKGIGDKQEVVRVAVPGFKARFATTTTDPRVTTLQQRVTALEDALANVQLTPGPQGPAGPPGPAAPGGGSPLAEALRQALRNWLLG